MPRPSSTGMCTPRNTLSGLSGFRLPVCEAPVGLAGDRHVLSITGSLSPQDVSVYCPEPGAAEEGFAFREAKSVSVC